VFSIKKIQKGIEKEAKRIVDLQVKSMFMQDINAISCAWIPAIATRLKQLFFTKWDANNSQVVRDVTAHFTAEWRTERLGKWSCGHAHNSVINTNGLEATNKVIKDELTHRQHMPVMDFLTSARQWLAEQSAKRGEGPIKVVS
jgi:transposase-like protein